MSLGTIDFKNIILRIYFGSYRTLMNESKARHKCSVTQTLTLQKEKTNLEIIHWQIFPGDAVVDNPPASARDAGLEKEMTSPSRVLAWKISWTEALGGLQSIGQQSQTPLSMHTQNNFRNFVKCRTSTVLYLHKIQSSKQMYSSYFLTSYITEGQEDLFLSNAT